MTCISAVLAGKRHDHLKRQCALADPLGALQNEGVRKGAVRKLGTKATAQGMIACNAREELAHKIPPSTILHHNIITDYRAKVNAAFKSAAGEPRQIAKVPQRGEKTRFFCVENLFFARRIAVAFCPKNAIFGN